MNDFVAGWWRYWLSFTLSWPTVLGFIAGSLVSTAVYEFLKGFILAAWEFWRHK